VSEPPPAVEHRIPGPLQAEIGQKLALAGKDEVGRRLREGDPTLWGPPGAPEVANRLGWLTIAERMREQLQALDAFADQIGREGYSDVVLLGMGGSSLAPEVLRRSFGRRPDRPALHVLDSTDAGAIRAVQSAVDLERTLFVVSSKSGGTIEPLSLFAHFWSLLGDGRSFAAITDPDSGLEQLAREREFRRVFHGDPAIGGRYSALSPFGIVPADLIGVDVLALLSGAPGAWDTTVEDEDPPATHGAAVWLGAALSALAQTGRDKLTFLIAPTLPGLGLWLEQLVAESTGKHGTGILPVADEPVGEPELYGEDRVFAYLPDIAAHEPELDARAQALAAAGHPVITIPTRGPTDLGRVFMLAELAVAVAGWGLEINPFDQPNVQQAKDATKQVLDAYEQRDELPMPADADDAALRSLLLEGGPPGYVALMAYVAPSPEFDAAAAELREAIRAPRRLTTTFGYGPRFLHSTGQYHKGGPRHGRFLQLLHDSTPDVPIPGASYTFTTLKNAQAIGDLNTLRELGLPAERVRLEGDDPAGALRALTAKIREWT
jgi:transaldolase / glucose-6-phosphate isomerase